jgi:hypothetical protein
LKDEIERKTIVKDEPKKLKLNRANPWNVWSRSWDQNYSIEDKHEKNHETKFLII